MDNEFIKYKNKRIEDLELRMSKDSGKKEQWVVSSFLKLFDISYNEDEIIKMEQDSKIDIKFRDINFQVKTSIFPKSYKPNEEDKNLKETIRNTTNIEELNKKTIILQDGPGWHEPEVFENFLIEETQKFTNGKTKSGKEKYPINIRKNLDLLVYIEISIDEKRLSEFRIEKIFQNIKSLGWKSISCNYGGASMVLYCTDDASDLLKKILHKKVKMKKYN